MKMIDECDDGIIKAHTRIRKLKWGHSKRIDIRRWYYSDFLQMWKPTRKGIWIPTEDLDKFIRILQQLKKEGYENP